MQKTIVTVLLLSVTASAYCLRPPDDYVPMPPILPMPVPILPVAPAAVPALGVNSNTPKITLSDLSHSATIINALNKVRKGELSISEAQQYLRNQLYPQPRAVARKETSSEDVPMPYTKAAFMLSAAGSTYLCGRHYLNYDPSGTAIIAFTCITGSTLCIGTGVLADTLAYALRQKSPKNTVPGNATKKALDE
ncbi:MAG TPA: hypothetical protein VGT41_01180 [Candidatus Babeliales bacterium]|nr:hypothetical protein [Candidatus Babeliales bacterium]